MITSIRYRGFSFYYKDNDNKYKEIFDEILAYNFKTVKVRMQKSRPEAAVFPEQGGEADGARTRDLQRDRLAL